jgi:Icc-related predicted phosphoesterase
MKIGPTCLSVALLAAGCASAPPPAPYAAKVNWLPGSSIALVGDLQRTSVWEFWREQNDRERVRIVRHIAAESPALLVLLGDLVWDGSSTSQWGDFDVLMRPVREKRIPVIATPGNHDYLWGGRDNVERMFERFKAMGRSTYSWMTVGPVGLVFVDSNRERLGAEAWGVQQAWLVQVLAGLDADPNVRGVMVMQHHPPYTNSTVTGDDPDVQEALLPAFVGARKTMAMVAGHVHAYERFELDGKHLLVSGGGGGPRVRLFQGRAKRHPSLRSLPGLSPFHVIWLTPGTTGVQLTVRGVQKGDDEFAIIDDEWLRFP